MSRYKLVGLIFLLALLPIFPLRVKAQVNRSFQTGWWAHMYEGGGGSKLATYASDGNTLVIGDGHYASLSQLPTIRSFLDEANKYGIKVIVNLTGNFPNLSSQDFTSTINSLKNHPALFGYLLGDEPEIRDSEAEHRYLKDNPGYYRLAKEADPNHPVLISFDRAAHDAEALMFFDVLDIAGVHTYPFWYMAPSGEFENSEGRLLYDTWKAGLEAARSRGKSFIATTQGFGNNTIAPYRNPTYKELRYQVFTAVVVGVDKILFWMDSWGDKGNMKPLVAQMVGQMQSIGAQMNAGVTNDSRIGVSITDRNQLVYRYGVSGNSHAILAVNIANRGSASGATLSNVQFTLPSGVNVSQVEVLHENRSLPVTNRIFKDTFNPFEVHLYRFTAGAIPTPTPTPSQKLGDINSDGRVNIVDIGIIIDNYGKIPPPNPKSDLNGDGIANIVDIGIVIDHYEINGTTPTRTPTPIRTPTPSPQTSPTPISTPPVGYLPAFPGAEGFGSQTRGGRGGKVIEVTNLNDSGSGSLRACADASGPRICVFRTGGTISLASDLSINNPYITIAGQTVPGGGITLKDGGVFVRTHDVVIRYLTVRRGPGGTNYAYLIGKPNSDQIYNIIVDHSSTSWATDQTVTTWWLTRDTTIQWIIISESLDCSTHPKGCHSKALHIGGYSSDGGPGAQDISVHHNLLTHYGERGPDLTPSHSTVDVVNNVAYNAKWTFAHIALNSTFGPYGVNFVKNYYKYGPDSGVGKYEIGIDDKGGSRPQVYLKGNIGPHRPTDNLAENLVGTLELRQYVVNNRFPAPAISETSALTAYDQVLAAAGNSKGLDCSGNWFNRRDAIDTRIVNEVRNGTGRIIDNPPQVGGWISIDPGTPCPDSDHDGMPDQWENRYGFNPTNAADNNQDADGDGYTNIEELLNGTTPK